MLGEREGNQETQRARGEIKEVFWRVEFLGRRKIKKFSLINFSVQHLDVAT